MIARCERYFCSLDRLIGDAVGMAGDGATVLLASDHGFGPTREVFHINSWLAQEGYLAWAEGSAKDQSHADTDVGFAEMTRHVHALDWSRTVAFAATPSSQGINIVERVPGTDDPLPEDVRADIAVNLADALLALRHPVTDRPVVEEVWTREQAFAGPYEVLGPDLSVILTDGGTISILPSESIVAERPELRGHHRWEGIFIAAGPGIRAGARTEELSIVDVAPLILHRLGLPVPDDMTGRVPLEIFEPDELRSRPPRRTAPRGHPVALKTPGGLELDSEEQTAVMQRLRALGYVE